MPLCKWHCTRVEPAVDEHGTLHADEREVVRRDLAVGLEREALVGEVSVPGREEKDG